IEAAGAETVAAILEAQPGIELAPGLRGFGVRMQGLDPQYVLILVDGERVMGRLGGAIDLTRLPTESIERIEIVKGAGSALHGADAVAGVINIVTRRPRADFEAGAHLSGGSQQALDASARIGIRRRRFDAQIVAGVHRAAGWDLTPNTPDTTASAFRIRSATLSGGVWATSHVRIGVKADYTQRRQDGVGSNAAGAVFDRRTLSEQASLTVEPDWRFTGGNRLRLTGHHGVFDDQFLSDQRGSTALDQLQRARERATRLGSQLDLALHARHSLVLGSDLLIERMSSPRLSEGRGARTRVSLFGQHDWRLAERPRIAVQPGVRFDGDSQFGAHVSPKLATRWDPHPTLALRAAYGFGYRAPSFQELHLAFDNPGAGYMVAGNPMLAPETSRSFNLEGQWRAAQRARVISAATIGIFRSDIRNLIITRLRNPDVLGAPSLYSYDNVAAAHTQGSEAAISSAPAEGLSIDLGYTFTAARDQEANRALEGRARHRGTFRLHHRHDGIGFVGSLRGAIVGPRPYYLGTNAGDDRETDQAPPHATLGVRCAQTVWRTVDLVAGVDNLLGAGDERYLPIAPRRFYGGLDVRH
ncbi:MAG TPA: TonB-dependent receptor, partial [Polyangia bacterium]